MSAHRRTSISQLLNPASPDPRPAASPQPSGIRENQQQQQPVSQPPPSGPPGPHLNPHAHQGHAPPPVYPYPYPAYSDPNWQVPYCILPPHYYPGPQPPPPTSTGEQPSPSQTRAPTPTGYPSAPRPDYYRGEPPPHLPPPPPGYSVYGPVPGYALAQHHYQHQHQHPYPHPHMYPVYYPPPMSVIYAAPISYHGYPAQPTPSHEPPHPGPQSQPASTKRAPSNSGDEAPPKQKQKRAKSSGRGKATNSESPAPGDPGAGQVLAVSVPVIPDPAVGPLHPELQLARCMSPRYRTSPFPRCVACTRRWAGDVCRFQGLRVFLRDAQGTFRGVTFVEARPKPDSGTSDAPSAFASTSSQAESEPLSVARLPDVARLPTSWNRPMGRTERRRVMEVVARALVEVLEAELAHLRQDGCMRRSKTSDVRPTCDMCQTALFALSHICRLCGREACSSCFANVRALTPHIDATVEQQAQRDARARANPSFLACTRRSEHGVTDFSPITHFEENELVVVVEGMRRFLQDVEGQGKGDDGNEEGKITDAGKGMSDNGSRRAVEEDVSSLRERVHAPLPSVTAEGDAAEASEKSSGNPTKYQTPAILSPLSSTETLPSHPVARYAEGELTETAFRALLASGTPIVVSLDPARFASFTPTWFREKYGGAPCAVVETQTDSASRGTVAEFFARFGSSTPPPVLPAGSTEMGNARKENTGADKENQNTSEGDERAPVKLKDWPPPGGAGFRSAVPELWDALQRGLPLGSFCRRDGVLNLASHFPSSSTARGPELGPKLYTATKTHTGAGSRGSTRLHLDAADGVNLLLHAEPAPDGSPGGAVWDLFRAEDADTVRRFLARRAGKQSAGKDPLLAGAMYVDDEMRRELWAEHGIASHRIVQHAGDAVFIPAGVAHQVANAADCIKVAVDFVSPEGVGRCEDLMRACRAQNQGPAWHEDGLRLREMMWYAWVNCARMEEAEHSETGRG